MCDYSLDLVASRPAKVGDELVTTQFKNSITRGFAAIGEPNVAVCLLPGTEVAFEKEVKYERFFAPFPIMKFGRLEKKVAQFRQINVAARASRCAVEFPDGETVLLTQLCEGQHATVLQLPASRPVNAAEGQKRDSLVNQSGAHYRACLAVPLVGEGAHRERGAVVHHAQSKERRPTGPSLPPFGHGDQAFALRPQARPFRRCVSVGARSSPATSKASPLSCSGAGRSVVRSWLLKTA